MIKYICFFILYTNSLLAAESLIDKVRTAFKEGKLNSIESMMDILPEVYLENYLFAFSGSSEIGTSLESPRTFLYDGKNPASLSMVSFASSGDMKHGNVAQFVEYDPKTRKINWAEYDIINRKFNDKPKNCLACHKGVDEDTFKLIWEPYPDWAGFYGQSHNGVKYKKSVGGASSFPVFKFEEEGFEAFKKSLPKNDRLKKLKVDKDLTVFKMTERNSDFTGKLLTVQKSIAEQVIEDKIGFRNFRFEGVDAPSEEELEKFRQEMLKHGENKRKRMIKIASSHDPNLRYKEPVQFYDPETIDNILDLKKKLSEKDLRSINFELSAYKTIYDFKQRLKKHKVDPFHLSTSFRVREPFAFVSGRFHLLEHFGCVHYVR